MKSVHRRFLMIQDDYPMLSSYICFSRAVKDQDFSPKTIETWFNKLVDKDDYDRSDKKTLLAYLFILSSIDGKLAVA